MDLLDYAMKQGELVRGMVQDGFDTLMIAEVIGVSPSECRKMLADMGIRVEWGWRVFFDRRCSKWRISVGGEFLPAVYPSRHDAMATFASLKKKH